MKCRCLRKGVNSRTQREKTEEDDRVEKYNSISDKTLRIPSSRTWTAVGAKSVVLRVMCPTAIRRLQMCVCVLCSLDGQC